MDRMLKIDQNDTDSSTQQMSALQVEVESDSNENNTYSASTLFAMCSQVMTDAYQRMSASAGAMCASVPSLPYEPLRPYAPQIAAGFFCAVATVVIVVPCVLLLNQPCEKVRICNKTDYPLNYLDSGIKLYKNGCYTASLPKTGEPTQEEAVDWGDFFPAHCTQKLRADGTDSYASLVEFDDCASPNAFNQGFCTYYVKDQYSISKSASVLGFFRSSPSDESALPQAHPNLRGAATSMPTAV